MISITNKDKTITYKVIQFNIDGDGTAMVLLEDQSIDFLDKGTVKDYFLGKAGSEREWTVSIED